MNEYAMMAESYRTMAERGILAKKEAGRYAELYEFLAGCTVDDFCKMTDSAAFNEIICAYLKKAVRNAKLGKDIERKVAGELRSLFDEKTAKEVLGECTGS